MAHRARPAIPRAVWALGVVSLCMDLSSELIHAILPLYLAVGFGTSAFTIGIIEGVAEALALVVRMFSGALSDRFRRRKPLVVIGYGLAALSKIVFPFAPGVSWIVGARFADRIGKGIRGAPRDALIADIAPAEVRGASFGLRQSLDTVGALLGPLAAIAALAYFHDAFRPALAVAVVPAFVAVALLVVTVHEPRATGTSMEPRPKVELRRIATLGRAFMVVVTISAVLTLARFSEAFLVLRAHDVGADVANAPWVMVAMSCVYALVAYPTGRAVDRGHTWGLLNAGFLALIVADVVLARASSPWAVYAGGALWGLHMGLTQGLLAALVAAHAPADLRGTAFGFLNLVSGIALLLASVLAGWLWQTRGAPAAFYSGAVLTSLAWAALMVHGRGALRVAPT
ncbi:MAG: MFS transporter [Pseudomonadota bacterium]|nr:MFS transporter [Pseudomonadota bacterium]